MEASEAFERHEHVQHATHHHEGGHEEGTGFATQAALLVAIIAAFLAVATFKANEAVKEAIQEQTKISDTHATLQTERTQYIILELNRAQLAASVVSLARTDPTSAKGLLNDANSLDATATKLQPVIAHLEAEAKSQTDDVNHSNNQHLLYELAVVALQIGIVLASVSIIVKRHWLMYTGGVAGLVGVIVLIVGFAS
jgi:Domain of unknown function (DUF4337)